MLDVIRKKPKQVNPASIMPKESGVAGTAMASGVNPVFGQAQGGGTMMGMQQAPAAY